jgi:ParB/RepB/Spo0J family partition protein
MPKFGLLPRAKIHPPPQPLRMAMDDEKLQELAESIREFGLLQPICVTKVDGRYEIIDGHRRFVAAGLLGMEQVAVACFEGVEREKFGMMLHANIMREDVTAAEEGYQFVELATKHGWSIDELMRFFGKSESYINDRATLVSDFPDVTAHVLSRAMTWPQARAIMRMKDQQRRSYLIDQAVTCGATARNLATMIDQFRQQDRIAANVGAPAGVDQVYSIAEVPVPKCVWCTRDDDQANMSLIPVHSYHKRDLELLLDRVGNMPGVAAPAGAGGVDEIR